MNCGNEGWESEACGPIGRGSYFTISVCEDIPSVYAKFSCQCVKRVPYDPHDGHNLRAKQFCENAGRRGLLNII